MMKRIFIAIDLPEEHRERLSEYSETGLPGCRRTKPDQLHLTLRFAGNMSEESITLLKEKLNRAAVRGFTLTFSATGFFPNDRYPRVFWIGVDPCELLTELQFNVEAAVTEAGVPEENRKFVPHITLARLKPGSGAQESVPLLRKQLRPMIGESFIVNSFRLYSSTVTDKGAVHDCLEEFPLLRQ
jgi:2'-5' RNA ligase